MFDDQRERPRTRAMRFAVVLVLLEGSLALAACAPSDDAPPPAASLPVAEPPPTMGPAPPAPSATDLVAPSTETLGDELAMPASLASPDVLFRVDAPDPARPDSVGRLLPRRLDDPDRETIERYYLYLPPGVGQDARTWPVLLYLHGSSLRGDDLERVKRYGIPAMIEQGYQLPFIVLAPQLPAGQRWVDTDRMWTLLDEVVLRHYPVDRRRLYATGYSMGGGGTWRFAYAHAAKLAAAVPISATTPEPSEAWADHIADLPVRAYHGDADPDAAYAAAAALVDYLRARGARVDLVTIEGAGHDIVTQVYADPALYLWLLSHERD
jgi:predicted esterase